VKKSLNDDDYCHYLLWQADRRVSCRIPCVSLRRRTLLLAGLAVSRTTVAELGET
jgi:hypothetical protein